MYYKETICSSMDRKIIYLKFFGFSLLFIPHLAYLLITYSSLDPDLSTDYIWRVKY